MRKIRSSLYLITILVLVLTGWYIFFKTNIEQPELIQKQDLIQSFQQYRYIKFEGVDFQDLLAIIKGTIGQNLQIRITHDPQTKKSLVAVNYTEWDFPKIIDISKAGGRNPSKKYAYVDYQYNDQLSTNTRSFLSLCAQAGRTGRKVVRPFVKQTKLSSDQSWFLLETYYDVKQLDGLLAAAGYATLVDTAEYLKECPPNSPDHVSVHFIDNSQSSMGFTKANLRLKEDYYKAIVKNTTQKGWTECTFLDRARKRIPGKQFCVNGDIIKDWKVFEKDIVKNEKCLNIFIWRGIEVHVNDYRLKFSEDGIKYSSIDLAYALRPGQSVINGVEHFAKEALAENYIAVYVRSEFMLREFSMDYLRNCIDLVLEAVQLVRTLFGVLQILGTLMEWNRTRSHDCSELFWLLPKYTG